MTQYGDVSVEMTGYVALVEIHRPPHNFFDHDLIRNIADAFEALDATTACRALVLAAEGKSFCAGANFHPASDKEGSKPDNKADGKPAAINANPLYQEAVRLFACKKPIVGAIHGPAVGGGLGVALVPDFRIVCPETRFAANFVKLGIHPGFGLTHTLPRLIGIQKATHMFLTGRRIDGQTALDWGLADVLTSRDQVREEAMALATEIAEAAPLAVQSTRATLRGDLAGRIKAQTDHELAEQTWLFKTEDHAEGVRSFSERRPGNFKNK